MNPTNKLHRSRVDWATIKEGDFNRVVESILMKLHESEAGRPVAINGRGGDKGIDVAVWDGDIISIIYQLKYYPQGFTGGNKKSRQPKVKESFETAWKNHAPAEWILVMPPNPHLEEKTFVDGLPGDRPVKIDIWGQAKLDTILAEYPAIERAALREETVDLFVQMHQEHVALVGPDDLATRVTALGEVASSRSQYWDTSFSLVDGEYEENYTPKHPDAMKVEPIRTYLTLTFGQEHSTIAEKVREGLEYGIFDQIDLPPNIAKFTREGPSWLQPPRNFPNSGVLLLQEPQVPDKRELITLNFTDSAGYAQGRFEGIIIARASGSKGSQVKLAVANIVTVITKIDHDRGERQGELFIKFNLIGAQASDARMALHLIRVLRTGVLMELYHQGKLVSKSRMGSEFADHPEDPYTEELLDDLCALQQRLPGSTFTLPEETSNRERAMIRVTRLLLDGGMVYMPPEAELTITLSGKSDENLIGLICDGGQCVSQIEAFRTEIQGSKYDLGPATFFHRNLRVVDSEKVLQALESGSAEGLEVRLRPKDDVLILAWLGHATGADSPLPPPISWNLTGFEIGQIG